MLSFLNFIFERYGKIQKLITPDIGILQFLYSWDFSFFIFFFPVGLCLHFETSKPFPTYL